MTYSIDKWFLEQELAKDTLVTWQELVDLMAELCQTPAGFIVQMTTNGYQVVISNKSEENPYPPGGIIPTETDIFCRKVVEENRPLYVANATQLEEWQSNPEVTEDRFNSYLGFPLHWPNGEIFGTICVMDFKITNYDERYHRLLAHFKKMAERELHLLKKNLDVEKLSVHDEQTGLLNRRGFNSLAPARLKLANRHQEDIVVCYFDLDNLKKINDSYDHKTGDLAIRVFAKALKDSLRNTDIIARFGGDEFVAIIFMEHIDETSLVNKRLRALLNQSELNFDINYSVGAITISHEKALDIDIEKVIAQADSRMYVNKRAKKMV